MKILVVDDEKVLVKGIKFNLESEGYQVETGCDGEEAVELARSGGFDLIILDLMMPKIDGLQACMRIREFSNVPIIMLTARSEDADKIIGFECGADDYITKPFNILELKARVRALLRRAGMAAQKEKKARLTAGHIVIDADERSAWKGETPVDLTAKEFDLIELLMRNPGRVYSRENLLNVVWGYEYAGDYRTVDVHVRRLREKLELDPARPEYILTKWGVGYYFKNSCIRAPKASGRTFPPGGFLFYKLFVSILQKLRGRAAARMVQYLPEQKTEQKEILHAIYLRAQVFWRPNPPPGPACPEGADTRAAGAVFYRPPRAGHPVLLQGPHGQQG